jgi:hypothetical protein
METAIDLCYEAADVRSHPLALSTLPFEAMFEEGCPERSYWNLRQWYDADPDMCALPEEAMVAVCCTHLEDFFGSV